MRAEDLLLLAVRPPYARLIVEGAKSVDLRRLRPRVSSVQSVLIYATSPEMALLGTCRLDSISEADTSELWAVHQAAAAIDREDFDAYFAGRDRGVALFLSHPRRLDQPIGLTQIRSYWPGFRPPRSFGYVSRSQADMVPSLGPLSPNGLG